MAWTEQCKIHFKTVADAKYFKNGSKGIKRILRELSQESGIPFKTLDRWWYEQEDLKNEANPKDTKNKDKTKNLPSLPSESKPQCIRCEERTVELNTHTKKPVSPSSPYFGLCSKCRKEQSAIKKNVISNDERDLPTTCPKCKHLYYLRKDELKKWIKN